MSMVNLRGSLIFLLLVLTWEELCIQADHNTLMSKVQTPQAWEVVDKEFREIKEWFLLNKLLLNEDKTQNLVCTLISEPVEVLRVQRGCMRLLYCE